MNKWKALMKEGREALFGEFVPMFRGVDLRDKSRPFLRSLASMSGLTEARQQELFRYIEDPTPGNELALNELARRYLEEGSIFRYAVNQRKS